MFNIHHTHIGAEAVIRFEWIFKLHSDEDDERVAWVLHNSCKHQTSFRFWSSVRLLTFYTNSSYGEPSFKKDPWMHFFILKYSLSSSSSFIEMHWHSHEKCSQYSQRTNLFPAQVTESASLCPEQCWVSRFWLDQCLEAVWVMLQIGEIFLPR